MNCIWPKESWALITLIILSLDICKIVKLWFNENNGSHAKNVFESYLNKFIVKSAVKFPLCCFFRRQNLAVLANSTKQNRHTHIHRNGSQVFSKIRNLFIKEKSHLYDCVFVMQLLTKQKLCMAISKTLPAWESCLCAIFPITFMQILLWQECTSVFVRTCHFEMTADPTGPLGSWRAWTEVADPCSWQSCSNSSNTERGLWVAHWSCSRTSLLEETSIEPPSPYVYAHVWIYVCIYKNICTDCCLYLKYCCQEGGYCWTMPFHELCRSV